MTEQAASAAEGWRARLAASRAALLRALEGVTERDFEAAFDDDRSLVVALAELAMHERAAVARVRGGESTAKVPEKPLAPQVIHDLAGARYQIERLLADSAAGDGADATLTAERVSALVDAIADRELAIAARIAARPRG
ncbi:MAG: hypothetical protein O3B31_01445 [Chloroflexi bacterium]|nr:hypothetical protein [Chloroflexota bacterium]MDA1002005.1 hypothetical protein [Chloroflexota bacterium]